MIKPKTVAIVLAAGTGSRFHSTTHKLLAPLQGRAVYQWSIATPMAAGFRHVIVVSGAVPLQLDDQFIAVHNPHFTDGQMTSLRCGLDAAADLGAEAVVVGLGDQPFLTVDAWQAIARCNSPIAVATYDGKKGHPVKLHNSVWPMLDDAGDQGARSLIGRAPQLVCELACAGSPADIDTVEDLQLWNSSMNSSSTDQ